MTSPDPTNAKAWLLTLPPTSRQTRWVIAFAACQLMALALLAPFADIQVWQINGFIPLVEGIEFVTNLVTSVLLFSQFATQRLSALLILACGYLLSALIIIPHALSFPGAFSPLTLPGADVQTTAWLSWFWHIPFVMALLGYALMRNSKFKQGPAWSSPFLTIAQSVALVVALVCGLVLLATMGTDRLPALFADSVRRLTATPPANYSLLAIMILLSASAIAVLWVRRRSILDQWLMIVALDEILHIVILILLSPKRFDVGFYGARAFSLVTSTIVMVVLLVETMRLYAEVTRLNEDKIRRLVDSNIIGILIGNPDGSVQEANQAFLRIVGYDQADVAAGRLRRTELTPPDWHDRDAQAVTEMRTTGTAQPFEKEYFRKDGGRVPVLVGGATLDERGEAVVIFAVDLTERKRAEAALAHANRVATMGQLSASIAHEVNQPLAALLTNAQTAVRWLASQPPNLERARPLMDRIISDAKRTADIVSRIRNFSKKAPVQPENLDINETILEALVLTRTEISAHDILAKTQMSERLPHVLADRVQFQQVMLNLIMNAIEALSEVNDGPRELLISSSETELGNVLVTVRDTGPGLSQVSAEGIFEAFHTTKPGGLGMGLPVCRSIVEAHGGRLWVAPNEPRGAVFSIVLPSEEKSLEGLGSSEA